MIPGFKSHYTGILCLALPAAALATFCDAVHVFTGTLVYTDPWLFKQAAWVFPLFYISFAGMAAGYFFITSQIPDTILHKQSTAPGGTGPFIETLTSFGLVYLLSGFGNQSPLMLSMIFYAAFCLRLAVTYEKAFLLGLALLLALGGMFVEGTLAVLDMVHYRQPEIYNVPFWLGGLYMHGAFALREGMRFFVYKKTAI